MIQIVLNLRGLSDNDIESKLRALALAQTDNPTAAPGLTITPAELRAAQKRSNRAKSRHRARVEHIFGFMTGACARCSSGVWAMSATVPESCWPTWSITWPGPSRSSG